MMLPTKQIWLRFLALCIVFKAIIISLRVRKLRNSHFSFRKKFYAVDEWLITGASEDLPQQKMIRVRFINNLSGRDIIAETEEGKNLLAVGDQVGVQLPRACRTGLCGSCTCELQDPEAIATSSNPRNGYATIRACSTKCYVPEGMTEMVIDVYRMKNIKEASIKAKSTSNASSSSTASVDASYIDPMARFSGDWEKEFRPQWELTKAKESKGLTGASDPKMKSTLCTKCQGAGRVVCYACEGRGTVLMGTGSRDQCSTCVGRLTVGCGTCRGTGKRFNGK